MTSILYITLKDVRAFFFRERKLFLFYLISMVICSFSINFAYSFANYRGEIYDQGTGESTPVLKVYSEVPLSTDTFNKILDSWNDSDSGRKYPIAEYVCFSENSRGLTIAGASFISPKYSRVTGLWAEGYWSEITPADGSVIAINGNLLDYSNNKMKMTGETYELDGREYIIKGVYEKNGISDAMIFYDDFSENYGSMDSFWVIMQSDLDEDALKCFTSMLQGYIAHGSIEYPQNGATTGSMVSASNKMQYSLIIAVLVYFVAMMYNFWHERNLPAYTVYWVVGMPPIKIIGIAVTEMLLLFGGTYLVGLMFNLLVRLFLSDYLPVSIKDIILGFGLIFTIMLVCSIKNMYRMCKDFSLTNLKGD